MITMLFSAHYRPLEISNKVFRSAEWREVAVAEIRKAQCVILGSYMFDADDIQKALLAELRRKGKDFRCAVIVDEDMHMKSGGKISSDGCAQQKAMLKTLKEAGCHVYLAHGGYGSGRMSKYRGSFHIKSMVLDARIAFIGSANYTEASIKNWEIVLRVTGPAAADMNDILKEVILSEKCNLLK